MLLSEGDGTAGGLPRVESRRGLRTAWGMENCGGVGGGGSWGGVRGAEVGPCWSGGSWYEYLRGEERDGTGLGSMWARVML